MSGVGADDSAFSDLASATFRPQLVSRARYLTVAQRCELGLADASLRCGAGAGPAGSTVSRTSSNPVAAHKISGRVITADGYGVPGVTVIASRIGVQRGAGESDSTSIQAEQYTRYRAVSGADGSYAFADIPDGDYTIRSNRHDNYASQRITVRAGVEYADLVLEEERQVTIEGRVTDDYGLPLGYVSVLPVLVGSPSVRTDMNGRYSLPVSLSPQADDITLRFEAPGFREESLTTLLPRMSRGEAAADVTRLELNAELESVELTTNVRGSVMTADGNPVAGRIVELSAVGEQRRYQAVTNLEGSYEFPTINAPMSYELSVSGAPDYADYHANIRVTRFDYEFDVVVERYEVGSLRGRIVGPDGAPIPDFELAIRNVASSEANAVVRSDRAGNFALERAPAGRTVLSTRSMPSFFIRGLDVDPGRETDIDVVLDWGQHELTGRVVDRYGRAVPASRVILKWEHVEDGIQSSATRRTATDSLGNFKFDKLGSGPHSLVVDAPGYATATLDHDLSRDGYNVTVRLN